MRSHPIRPIPGSLYTMLLGRTMFRTHVFARLALACKPPGPAFLELLYCFTREPCTASPSSLATNPLLNSLSLVHEAGLWPPTSPALTATCLLTPPCELIATTKVCELLGCHVGGMESAPKFGTSGMGSGSRSVPNSPYRSGNALDGAGFQHSPCLERPDKPGSPAPGQQRRR